MCCIKQVAVNLTGDTSVARWNYWCVKASVETQLPTEQVNRSTASSQVLCANSSKLEVPHSILQRWNTNSFLCFSFWAEQNELPDPWFLRFLAIKASASYCSLFPEAFSHMFRNETWIILSIQDFENTHTIAEAKHSVYLDYLPKNCFSIICNAD